MAAADATTRFKWNAAKEQALWLIFNGKLSQAEVAENVGVATRTCERWVAHPAFQSRLAQMRADLDTALKATLYVSKESRIMALSDMALKARCEFEARPWLKEVRPTKDGAVTNESFNGDAFAAFRGALDDIAKEKGERSSKVDVTSGGERLTGIADIISVILSQPSRHNEAAELLDALAERTSGATGG